MSVLHIMNNRALLVGQVTTMKQAQGEVLINKLNNDDVVGGKAKCIAQTDIALLS